MNISYAKIIQLIKTNPADKAELLLTKFARLQYLDGYTAAQRDAITSVTAE